jgi:hypothetical protein
VLTIGCLCAVREIEKGCKVANARCSPRRDHLAPILFPQFPQIFSYKINCSFSRHCGRNELRSTMTPMVEFAVLGLQNPAGAQRPDAFLCDGIHIQTDTVNPILINHPHLIPSRQALPARYATPSVAATTMYTHRVSAGAYHPSAPRVPAPIRELSFVPRRAYRLCVPVGGRPLPDVPLAAVVPLSGACRGCVLGCSTLDLGPSSCSTIKFPTSVPTGRNEEQGK